ncbi:MAG: hypothetical protein V1921_05895 [Candidatus Altiarchaeota archaeon]
MSLMGMGGDKPSESHKMWLIPAAIAVVMLFVIGTIGILGVYYILSRGSEPDAELTTSTTTTSTTSTSSILTTSSAPSTTSLASTSSVPTTTAPTCDDGVINQDEEDVDCGGPCDPCMKSAEKVALCLSMKGVTLYMRNDDVCLQCKSIREYFGNSLSLINVIDCDESDNEDSCDDMLDTAKEQEKRQGYPTWNILGELYPGAGVERIKAVTNCK